MKQLIIGKGTLAATTGYSDPSTIADGAIGLYKLSDGSLITTADELKENFAVVLGRGTKAPIVFPEVDVNTLQVTKAEYQKNEPSTTITFDILTDASKLAVEIIKLGTGLNERSVWLIEGANFGEIIIQVNKTTDQHGVFASYAGALRFRQTIKGHSAKITPIEGFDNRASQYASWYPDILDKAYLEDLASRCAAGKGFNYLDDGGKELYPGYPETIEDTQYCMYTLRFAVPRASAKQRDEVVYQTLHIAVPMTGDIVTTLDTVFDLAEDAG